MISAAVSDEFVSCIAMAAKAITVYPFVARVSQLFVVLTLRASVGESAHGALQWIVYVRVARKTALCWPRPISTGSRSRQKGGRWKTEVPRSATASLPLVVLCAARLSMKMSVAFAWHRGEEMERINGEDRQLFQRHIAPLPGSVPQNAQAWGELETSSVALQHRADLTGVRRRSSGLPTYNTKTWNTFETP